MARMWPVVVRLLCDVSFSGVALLLYKQHYICFWPKMHLGGLLYGLHEDQIQTP